MLKICSAGGCKTVVTVDPLDRNPPRCEKHPYKPTKKRKVYSHHIVNGRNIYSTNEWKKLSKAKKRLNPLCEECERMSIYTPAKIADHIIEIEDGGSPYDINNLQSLCDPCHKRKTAQEAKKRKDNNGFGSISDF